MAESVQVTVDETGCISVPQAAGERLGLRPGMTLRVEAADDHTLRLSIEEEAAGLVERDGLLIFTGELEYDVGDPVAWSRHLRLQSLLDGFAK